MSDERDVPDEPAGPFPAPPVTFTDGDGRDIEIRVFDPDADPDQYEALVSMYLAFDPSDRAQGIPPGNERRIRDWLDTILEDDCLNVVAWDGDDAIGHATLVPDDETYELAIFVLQAYQGAGVGTRVLEALLGYGKREGVQQVWLTVERWNTAAVSLYQKVGFETSDAESFELEMALRLN